MGYRSEVRIVTSKKGYKELSKYVENKIKSSKENNFNLLENTNIFKENKYQCYFGWNYVKWYEYSYPDVDAIMSGLQHLKENDYSYRYSRIGEAYDDYDEHYYESEREEEQDLDFPSMIREFDDAYIINNMIDIRDSEKELE